MNKMCEYVQMVYELVKDPNNLVYLHCYGGHGRAGMTVAVLMGMFFNIRYEEALKRTQFAHDCRPSGGSLMPSPEYHHQRVLVAHCLRKFQPELYKDDPELPPWDPGFQRV